MSDCKDSPQNLLIIQDEKGVEKIKINNKIIYL